MMMMDAPAVAAGAIRRRRGGGGGTGCSVLLGAAEKEVRDANRAGGAIKRIPNEEESFLAPRPGPARTAG